MSEIINERKTERVTKKDKIRLERMDSLSEEDKQYQRLKNIEQYEIQAKIKQREIDYKKAQIKNGESLEKHESFVDGKKPMFMLESDIDKLEFEINGLRDVIKSSREEYEKSKKEKNDSN